MYCVCGLCISCMLTSAVALNNAFKKLFAVYKTHTCKIVQRHLKLDGDLKKRDLTAAIFLAFSTSHLWALIFPPSLLSRSIPLASQSLSLANIDLAK